MFKTYFDNQQLLFVFIGTLFSLISIFFFVKEKYSAAVFFLFLAAFSFFLFSALLDKYLNPWDERFHALVAKNMMNHFFKPTLYENSVLSMGHTDWSVASIWLHKQPLFLWQIALSFKIFGVSEFALRLPSALLGSLMVLFAYRTGKLLVNARVGYYAAFLICTSHFFIELISGHQQMDHNDVSFVVYISASIWAWTEYVVTKKKCWIILIGIFSGFAILCKWLAGLLIYLAWGIYNVGLYKIKITKYKDIAISFFVTILVALPWQIYILINFHAQAIHEYQYNSRHLFEVVEGHGGPWWYYFDTLDELYGIIIPFVLPLGFFFFYRYLKDFKLRWSLIALPVFVYTFFSVSQTKMITYPYIVFMIVFLCLACLLEFLISVTVHKIKLSKIRKPILFVLLVIIGYFNFDIGLIQEKNTTWKATNVYTPTALKNKKKFQDLGLILPGNAVIFNLKNGYYVDCMFYSGRTSYGFTPSFVQYQELKKKKIRIAFFKKPDESIPLYLLYDPEVLLIPPI